MRPEHATALVTGGSKGIGAAIAQALAADGWHVAVNYRSDEDAARHVVEAIEQAGGRAAAVSADVTNGAADELFEAAGQLADVTPDVILSDLMMPDESGIDLLKTVRADERLKDVPFIILSAVSEQRYIDAAMEAGATDYWLKGSLTAQDLGRRLRPYLPGGVGWADDMSAVRSHV